MIQRFVPPRGRSGMYASQLHGAETEAPDTTLAVAEDDEPQLQEHTERAWRPEWTEEEGREWAEGTEESEAAEEQPRRRGRSHKIALWSSVVMVGVVLGLVIVGVMKFVTGPVEVKAPRKVSATKPISTSAATTNLLQGVHFTFSYPGEFDQIANRPNAEPFLEQYMLGSKSNYRHSISVELIKVSSTGGVDEHASYRGRQVKPEEYHETKETIGGDKVSIMTRADKQEQTLFWAHKGKVLAVAITSSDTKDDVTKFMAVIKDSVRWRQ